MQTNSVETKGSSVPLQVLTYRLGDEVFGVEIMSVREVLDYTVITKVPRTPEFMRGVINLRGNVVPVIDLKMKLGMGRTEQTVNSCIIIMEVTQDGELLVLGCLADSVQEVVDFEGKNIEDAPRIGTNMNTEFIKGMAKQEEKFVIILDTNRIFSANELTTIEQAAAAGT
ncbi:chemotaxis protein CheW [Chrysiogenes arsenatis]|uniref:chemotaxis protein CheW n=1 Tax=Chrysiogenes arsenatis TaxID=309797 RepID=UPI00040DD5DD|nr:chemotaxis protein CheW [Chrysiogenes arsenatis]